MTFSYRPTGHFDRLGALEQQCRQLYTDVQRLLQAQRPPGELPVSGGGGSSDSGTALARFQLVAKLYNGITSAGATRLDEPGTETISCSYGFGYWFGDEQIFAIQVDGVWQVVGCGTTCVANSTNTSAISKGASGTRTLANGKSVTLKAVCGSVGASKKYDACWDEYAKVWVAVAAEC